MERETKVFDQKALIMSPCGLSGEKAACARCVGLLGAARYQALAQSCLKQANWLSLPVLAACCRIRRSRVLLLLYSLGCVAAGPSTWILLFFSCASAVSFSSSSTANRRREGSARRDDGATVSSRLVGAVCMIRDRWQWTVASYLGTHGRCCSIIAG